MPTLHDGTEVAIDSEAWQHETEARAILSLPTLDARLDWLAYIDRRRGRQEGDRLWATMRAIQAAAARSPR